jgi:hypothetical protein
MQKAKTTTASGRLREGFEPPEITNAALNRFGRSIDVVKAKVRIEDVACEYGEFRQSGKGNLIGRCLSPEHTDKTPSMTIFTDTQRYKCFGCQISGDVIDLEMMCGNHSQLWTAMVALSVRYGVELPQCSEKWRYWQGEKHAIEDLGEHVRFQARCRRTFKSLVLNAPEIQEIEDPTERREEIVRCWEAFQEGLQEIDNQARRQRLRRLGR